MWKKAGLVIAVLLGAAACDPSTRPSRIVEPGWALRPADGSPVRRGRWQDVTVTVESVHLKDARLSLAAVYRAPDGTEHIEAFPAGNDREYITEGPVHLPFALSLGFRVPDGPPPTTQGCRRAAARSRCAPTWTRPRRRFQRPAGSRPIRSSTEKASFPGIFTRSWNG